MIMIEAENKRKKAQWHHHNDFARYICSACGNSVKTQGNYCNSCGARMQIRKITGIRW